MALPSFSMRELIDAGVHFGHKTRRWNPRMAPFIFGERNNVHIINLQHTVPMLHRALQAVRDTSAQNGRILFVGTKRQASDTIKEAAQRCGQYYVNHRWLGGMLTNWNTIQNSIRRLKKNEETLGDDMSGLTKKELLSLQRNTDKLELSLGGIRDMAGRPDLVFVIDTNREELAIQEAKKLGIPIVAIVDTNCSIDNIDFPIPGNDDAARAIKLYCQLISDAVLDGIQASLDEAPEAEEVMMAEEIVVEEAVEEGKTKSIATSKKAAYAEAAKKAAKKKEATKVAEEAKTESDAKEAKADDAKAEEKPKKAKAKTAKAEKAPAKAKATEVEAEEAKKEAS